MATTVRPRTIKKLEKPRPLKINQRNLTSERISTVDDIVSLIDNVAMHLNNGVYDPSLQGNIITMCNHLKLHSQQLEKIYKDQLDRAFIAIRNGSQDERLDMTTRVHLLELIELRAKQWHNNESVNSYYVQKLSNLEDTENAVIPETPSLKTLSTSPPLLGPHDVCKSSGKFSKPTKISGKNYCKDEVVIRNSDSGKVMGIKGRRVHMIEELSETIISFQRVNPGARERLVQITGTSEDKITYAKDLIKDTIQRNASPVRLEQGGREKNIEGSSSSLNSSASDESNRLQRQRSSLHGSLLRSPSTNDANIGEYKYTVIVGSDSLKITGTNLDLVRAAKLALDEYFSEESEHTGTGVEYFTFEEEPYASAIASTPPSAGQASFFGKNLSLYSDYFVPELSKTSVPEIRLKKKDSSRELSYEILMQCATGPFAKRPPHDWDQIQKECPNIVRKVHHYDNNNNNNSHYSTNTSSQHFFENQQFENYGNNHTAPEINQEFESKLKQESALRFNDEFSSRSYREPFGPFKFNGEATTGFYREPFGPSESNGEFATGFNRDPFRFNRETVSSIDRQQITPPKFNDEVISHIDRESKSAQLKPEVLNRIETVPKYQFDRESQYLKNSYSSQYFAT